MGTGVDNIDVDNNGDLWIGCHPIGWKILDFFNLFGAAPPSQVRNISKLKQPGDNSYFLS